MGIPLKSRIGVVWDKQEGRNVRKSNEALVKIAEKMCDRSIVGRKGDIWMSKIKLE
jgi:hypothetical protein